MLTTMEGENRLTVSVKINISSSYYDGTMKIWLPSLSSMLVILKLVIASIV